MDEAVTCPKCTRRLQLPADYMGQKVQCPSCETSFVAGEASPPRKTLPPADAIEAAFPVVLPAPETDTDAELEAPRPRRSRRLDEAKAPLKATPSRAKAVVILLVIAFAGVAAVVGFVANRGHRPIVKQEWQERKEMADLLVQPPQPPIAKLPERLLTPAEQKEHAKAFFDHFSGVMRIQNNGGEMSAFDSLRLVDVMLSQKLIPKAWGQAPAGLADNARQGVLKTSIYRGEHWNDFRISTVRQPRVGELIVVTRHPNTLTAQALRLRWWLVHGEGRWRIQDMEDVDIGVRLSLLVAADLQPPVNVGAAFVHPDILALRDAANAIMNKGNHADADRILRPVRVDELPDAAAASFHILVALIRNHQQRFEEAVTSSDSAQRRQPDLPGADIIRAVACNRLHRDEAALKHARLTREWLGEDPEVCFEMGLATQNLHRFAEAAALYRKTLDEHPNHKDALHSLIRCIGLDVKNDDIAERFLKLKRPQDHFELFAQDRWMNRDAKTLQRLSEAMRQLDPRHADAHFFQALAHAEQQRNVPALAAFRTANDLQRLDARRDYYFNEFAKTSAFRDNALQTYAALPDRLRSFRALGEALRNSGLTDDLRQLIEAHVKNHPQDEYVQLFQAELHLRDEEYELADRAFTKAFAVIKDPAVETRFRYGRVHARYQSGDVFGAYRDMEPKAQTFQQLADSCFLDKKAGDLKNLLAAHRKNDPGDPQLGRFAWRVEILEKRFAEAGKKLKSALDQKVTGRLDRYPVQEFLRDMMDAGQAVEAYRHAPDPAEALDIFVSDLGYAIQGKDLEPIVEEHRKRFPNDPILRVYAGQQAVAKQDWAKASQAYREAWKDLPEAKRPRWTHELLYARFKQGQAIEAYQEMGQRPEHFRKLVTMLLQEKQVDAFARLLEAHRPRRGNDPEFDAYEARLKIVRGKPLEAAELLSALLRNHNIGEQHRIGDVFLTDLANFDIAAEIYRCIPDKLDAFNFIAGRYRTPERAKQLERLIAEHTKHHPDDPQLLAERAESHMLQNDFAQAEKLFLLAKNKNPQNLYLARTGLIRARIKLGKAEETYQEFGATMQTFQDIANQCVWLKEAGQLERVLAAHRQAFPNFTQVAVWNVEVHWLKKDYAATVKAIEADRGGNAQEQHISLEMRGISGSQPGPHEKDRRGDTRSGNDCQAQGWHANAPRPGAGVNRRRAARADLPGEQEKPSLSHRRLLPR